MEIRSGVASGQTAFVKSAGEVLGVRGKGGVVCMCGEVLCLCDVCVCVVYVCMWCGVCMVCHICSCVWCDGNVHRGTCVCMVVHMCIKITTLIATKPSPNSSSPDV